MIVTGRGNRSPGGVAAAAVGGPRVRSAVLAMLAEPEYASLDAALVASNEGRVRVPGARLLAWCEGGGLGAGEEEARAIEEERRTAREAAAAARAALPTTTGRRGDEASARAVVASKRIGDGARDARPAAADARSSGGSGGRGGAVVYVANLNYQTT